MGWFELVSHTGLVERDLQDLFDVWSGDRNGWSVAGVPRWMDQIDAPTKRDSLALPQGYRFQPDGIWAASENTYILELKCAAKYEPLALAEVLHHAYAVGDTTPGTRVTPVIISSYSAYLRRAIRYLCDHSLDADAIRFYEAYPLRQPTSDERFLWLAAPVAPWNANQQPPGFLPDSLLSPATTWHLVGESGCWIGSRCTAGEERPLFLEQSVAVAPVSRSEGSFLVWICGASPADAGSYFLWRESGGDPRTPDALAQGLPG